jgi:sterol desaturase/sphingolipid hydroxylase (fatty acid hydroxylase superfamily)
MQLWPDDYVEQLHYFIDEWGVVVAVAIFIFELLVLSIQKKVNKTVMGDALANFFTLGFFIAVNTLLLGVMYVTCFYWVYINYSLIQLPTNAWTIIACIVLADIAYYWEHRFVHRVGFAWATHSVHHSSPFFNISVAYRFGPLDGLMPLAFHLPLAFLGFNPVVIFLAEMVVQVYQTLLHTETVRKFPRPIEAIFNTPSHHRVHHGSNREYLDKNYAGIFIIWDKMFGTFKEEGNKVVYGVTTPIDTINPVKVFFLGYYDLFAAMRNSGSIKNSIAYFFMPPGWKPKEKDQ